MEYICENIFVWHGDKKNDYRTLLKERQAIQLSHLVIPYERLVRMEQTAGDVIVNVNDAHAGAGFIDNVPEIPLADAMITNTKNLFLCVRTADCFPILIYDKKQKAIAAVHSGREGTRLNILGKTIQKMIDEFKCQSNDLHIVIGAGISANHYEVDKNTYHHFYKSNSEILSQEFIEKKFNESSYKINIPEMLSFQLEAEKIKNNQIQLIPECTYENQNYFSFRRDKGNNRQLSVIGIIQ